MTETTMITDPATARALLALLQQHAAQVAALRQADDAAARAAILETLDAIVAEIDALPREVCDSPALLESESRTR